jgi:hypothetical protein
MNNSKVLKIGGYLKISEMNILKYYDKTLRKNGTRLNELDRVAWCVWVRVCIRGYVNLSLTAYSPIN